MDWKAGSAYLLRVPVATERGGGSGIESPTGKPGSASPSPCIEGVHGNMAAVLMVEAGESGFRQGLGSRIGCRSKVSIIRFRKLVKMCRPPSSRCSLHYEEDSRHGIGAVSRAL